MTLLWTRIVLALTGVSLVLSAGAATVSLAQGQKVAPALITLLLSLAFIWFTIKDWKVLGTCARAVVIAREKGVDL